jgi:hypothetical protein
MIGVFELTAFLEMEKLYCFLWGSDLVVLLTGRFGWM